MIKTALTKIEKSMWGGRSCVVSHDLNYTVLRLHAKVEPVEKKKFHILSQIPPKKNVHPNVSVLPCQYSPIKGLHESHNLQVLIQ